MKKYIFHGSIALLFIFITTVVCAFFYKLEDEKMSFNSKEDNNGITKLKTDEFTNKEYNLPIVVINTNGNSIKRKENIVADIQIYDVKDKVLEEEPSFQGKVNLSIRGNSTSKYPKKQFSLKLINNNGEDYDKELLGMSKGAEWALNGPFSDKSLMRNYIAYKTGRNIMEYSPDAKFCEVFVIDDNSNTIEEKYYKGVYLLIEKIERSEERVDIKKSQNNINETSFIISKDRNKEEEISLNSYGIQTDIDSYAINIDYPKSKLTDEKYKYINRFISEFERVLYSDKFNDLIEGYSKYIDVESFVDFYIINEFFKNTDAGILSTYFYKDYQEKLKAGPIWDFNKCLGNHNEEIGLPYDYKGFFMINRPWFGRLMEDKSFSSKLVNRYKDLRKSYLSDEYLINLIDETVVFLGSAVDRNFNKWPIDLCNQAEVFEENEDVAEYSLNIEPYVEFLEKNKHLLKDTEYRSKSYDEEIEKLKEFIINRGKWIDDNIDSLEKWSN